MSRQIRNQIFNLKEGTAGKGGSGSDPIQVLVDAYKAGLTTPLTAGEEAVYYTAFKGLVDDGLWDKLDGLLVYYAPSEDAALRNWVRDAYHGTKVGAATTPSFTAKEGFITDAANGISPLWNFSDASKKCSDTSFSLIVYETNSAATNNFIAGLGGAADSLIRIRRSTDGTASRHACITALISPAAIGAADKQGWVCSKRNNGTHIKLHVNDAGVESAGVNGSGSVAGTNLLVSGANNWDGSVTSLGSAGVHRVLAWGAGFSDDDYNNFRTHLNKFFTDLP